MDEFELIQEIVQGLGQVTQAPHVVVGPGDDAAVLSNTLNTHSIASIDSQLAGHHFLPDAPPELIGYRAVMASVSDLAAMAAEPKYMLVALTLDHLEVEWVRGLVRGMKEAAVQCQIAICGGNLSRGPVAITLSVHGEAPVDKAVLRSGAQVGDLVQVSGSLGGAGACVRLQNFGIDGDLSLNQQSYYRPQARTDLVLTVRAHATACIDVSDGLLQDLCHVLSASQCGAELDASAIPLGASATLEDALYGGEDYQLIVTAPAQLPEFVPIGKIVPTQGVWLDGKMVSTLGFDHFRG